MYVHIIKCLKYFWYDMCMCVCDMYMWYVCIVQTEEQLLHKVFFVSSVRDISLIDWRAEYCSNEEVIDLPVRHSPKPHSL